MFAAGANLFGVVNFETFFKHTELWMAAISTVEYGDPVTQADMLRQLSPIHKVTLIKTPLLVEHGANNTNVPVVEAEQVVEALKRIIFHFSIHCFLMKDTAGKRQKQNYVNCGNC
ncbi:MAG: prolyl oligopeptidase family serine peptidase [Bacteroidota bacterium]